MLIGIALNVKNSKKQDFFILSDTKIIEKINQNNRDIRTLICKVKSFQMVPTDGDLHYEKETNFRLILNSFFGKELDLGSNEKIYWFWIKRFDKRVYFWERDKNSKVIDEFDPEYVKESLGIDEIPQNSIVLKSNKGLYKIIHHRKNQNGKDVIKIWIVSDEKIIEHELYDGQGNLILTSSITKFLQIKNKYIPTDIRINSNQLKCTLHLEEIQINEEINKSKWMIPNYESINISN